MIERIIESIITATHSDDLIWKRTHSKNVDGVDRKPVLTVQYETMRNDVVIAVNEVSRSDERMYNIGIDGCAFGESVSQGVLRRLFDKVKSNHLRNLVKRLNFDDNL